MGACCTQAVNRSTTCCFTGHRPEKIRAEWVEPLKFQIAEVIEQAVSAGYIRFICGMSRGFDLWAARAVVTLREKYPKIELEAAVPCLGQEQNWPACYQEEFGNLLRQADVKTCLSQEYHPGCMHERNRYMVEKSSLLIAFYNGDRTGGTAYTWRYACKQGLKRINLFEEETKQLCLAAEPVIDSVD